jgi:hypothetical protein
MVIGTLCIAVVILAATWARSPKDLSPTITNTISNVVTPPVITVTGKVVDVRRAKEPEHPFLDAQMDGTSGNSVECSTLWNDAVLVTYRTPAGESHQNWVTAWTCGLDRRPSIADNLNCTYDPLLRKVTQVIYPQPVRDRRHGMTVTM